MNWIDNFLNQKFLYIAAFYNIKEKDLFFKNLLMFLENRRNNKLNKLINTEYLIVILTSLTESEIFNKLNIKSPTDVVIINDYLKVKDIKTSAKIIVIEYQLKQSTQPGINIATFPYISEFLGKFPLLSLKTIPLGPNQSVLNLPRELVLRANSILLLNDGFIKVAKDRGGNQKLNFPNYDDNLKRYFFDEGDL